MYSNTGIQRSGATPFGAWTTTTWTGKKERQKVLAEIVMAHHIPYVATASIAFIEDLYRKTKKAQSISGPRYMEIFTPCPPGWRFDMSKTIELARLAVETGAWLLYEFENEQLTFNGPTKGIIEGSLQAKDVEDWLRVQGRFRNLTEGDLQTFKSVLQERWNHYRKLASL
jgi:pyruvate ferredoxin oxidoreductase beta subunit